MTTVTDLDLPVFDYTAPDFSADHYHRQLAEARAQRLCDITAERDGRLLTFGAGAHFCLGANLARGELEEALAFLAPRMPGLALDGPAQLGGVEGIYGINALPLRWG